MSSTWFLLLLLSPPLTLGGLPELPEDVLVLRLHFDAAAQRIVRLEDVCTAVEDPRRVWPAVREVILASQPRKGISRGWIEHRLIGAGLPVGRLQVTGPAMCRLESRRASGDTP